MKRGCFTFLCRVCGEIVSVDGWCQVRDCAFSHFTSCNVSSVSITEEYRDGTIQHTVLKKVEEK